MMQDNQNKFLQLNKDEIKRRIEVFTKKELLELLTSVEPFLEDVNNVPDFVVDKKLRHSVYKKDFEDLFIMILQQSSFKTKWYRYLTKSESSKYLYELLVWEYIEIDSKVYDTKFPYSLPSTEFVNYGYSEVTLEEELHYVTRRTFSTYSAQNNKDKLYIDTKLRNVLQLLFPLPNEYELFSLKEDSDSEFFYSNEENILAFIETIDGLLKSNLIAFGKTNEKPLSKSLNILKSSTQINEFFSEKKHANYVVDMLTRSFSYYTWAVKGDSKSPLETLHHFVGLQMADRLNFFITRIFISHLKKVRFDTYYSDESELFGILKKIISDIPENKENWVSMNSILKYCNYRGFRVDLEDSHKTKEYSAECDVQGSQKIRDTLYVADYYTTLFLEPMIKAGFFYLAALGLFEIKYNSAKSNSDVSVKGEVYVSVWDSIVAIKMSELGKYIFGYSENYEAKTVEKTKTEVKFDEFNTVIMIDKNDTLLRAQLEAYTEEIDVTRYKLSYTKIFKECSSQKVLELKIEKFYDIIKMSEMQLPQNFRDYFEEIKSRAGLLRRDEEHVVIELQNNKALLQLFMSSKKLQELVIKAQGYRIIVDKKDVSKVSKIVKESGFFVDF
jgi:hypothetical protein